MSSGNQRGSGSDGLLGCADADVRLRVTQATQVQAGGCRSRQLGRLAMPLRVSLRTFWRNETVGLP